MSTMIQDMLMFYKYGGKQLYYFNTFDGQGEIDINKMNNENKNREDFETQEEYDEYCESCVL